MLSGCSRILLLVKGRVSCLGECRFATFLVQILGLRHLGKRLRFMSCMLGFVSQWPQIQAPSSLRICESSSTRPLKNVAHSSVELCHRALLFPSFVLSLARHERAGAAAFRGAGESHRRDRGEESVCPLFCFLRLGSLKRRRVSFVIFLEAPFCDVPIARFPGRLRGHEGLETQGARALACPEVWHFGLLHCRAPAPHCTDISFGISVHGIPRSQALHGVALQFCISTSGEAHQAGIP